MSAPSIKKAKRPRIVTTLGTRWNSAADFEAGKRAVNIGRDLGIPPAAARPIVADK
jgi:hypothetical protein